MPVELTGRPASEGIFAGPLVRLSVTKRLAREAGSPEEEKEALEAAIAQAVVDLSVLLESRSEAASELLTFQIAMLEDDSLKVPALEAIAAGTAADQAWREALEKEAAGYAASEDEYFRARSADIQDIAARVLRVLSGETADEMIGGAVVLAEDLAPSAFIAADWSAGGAIALVAGSPSSHVAMLARAQGIPMVVGLRVPPPGDARHAIVDGGAGQVLFDPDSRTSANYARRSEEHRLAKMREATFLPMPAMLASGERIEVLINVAGLDNLDRVDHRHCDGIGLMRSEFLFHAGAKLPDEEQQYNAYRRFVQWANGKPVVIRTLDAGGDKPIAGLTPEGEKNPFLGLRGVRLTLSRPDVFAVQLRALARAAKHGNLRIMIPMVTVASELEETRALLERCVAELESLGVSCSRPPLGIMVEVPAVAIAPEPFSNAAFFSIGSNDLTQYVTAASRDEASVASLGDGGHPAVLKLISEVVRFGRETNMPVSICGDMAGDTRHLPMLIDAGVRTLSVAPSRLAAVKSALANISVQGGYR
ncbi:MAG: phosphoenolpyruvate--protein phosphotransferase [Aestuariivirga sp.]